MIITCSNTLAFRLHKKRRNAQKPEGENSFKNEYSISEFHRRFFHIMAIESIYVVIFVARFLKARYFFSDQTLHVRVVRIRRGDGELRSWHYIYQGGSDSAPGRNCRWRVFDSRPKS